MAYVKFQLSDGATVYIESSDVPRGNSGLIPRSPAAADQGGHSLPEALAPIGRLAQDMLTQFHAAEGDGPSDISISFGLKASAELGALVVVGSGNDTNFSVNVRWRKEEPAADGAADGDADKDADKDAADSAEKSEPDKEVKKPARKTTKGIGTATEAPDASEPDEDDQPD